MAYSFNNKGVSLIEAVSAIAVLSFGILSLMLLYTSSMRGNTTAQIITGQTENTATHIERLMGLPYNHIDLRPGINNFLTDKNGDGRLGDEIGACNTNTKPPTPPSGVDHCAHYIMGDIFWNVVEDSPIPHTKNIQIIVKTDGTVPNEVVMEYVKPFHL